MSVVHTVIWLQARGLSVSLEGEYLRVRPKAKITSDIRLFLKTYKQVIISSLKAGGAATLLEQASTQRVSGETTLKWRLSFLHAELDRMFEQSSAERIEEMIFEFDERVSLIMEDGNIPEKVAEQLAARDCLVRWLRYSSNAAC
jgi:hypothetical protein